MDPYEKLRDLINFLHNGMYNRSAGDDVQGTLARMQGYVQNQVGGPPPDSILRSARTDVQRPADDLVNFLQDSSEQRPLRGIASMGNRLSGEGNLGLLLTSIAMD